MYSRPQTDNVYQIYGLSMFGALIFVHLSKYELYLLNQSHQQQYKQVIQLFVLQNS